MNSTNRPPNPIEAAREAAGASYLGLSNKTGIALSTLRRNFENPENFTIGQLKKLSRELGAPELVKQLLRDTPAS